MKLKSSLHGAALLAALASGAAQAAVSYNTSDGDPSDPPGVDGLAPGVWVGAAGTPAYVGSQHAQWYAELNPGTTDVVSTANAIASGASSNPAIYDGLAAGPIGYQRTLPASFPDQGNGHGADQGLFHLTETTDLTITILRGNGDGYTVGDPSLIAANPGHVGASLYLGWDTSTAAASGFGLYTHNADNPRGTVGLTYIYGAGTQSGADALDPSGTGVVDAATYSGSGLSPIVLSFTDLAAGYYTLWLGGDSGGPLSAGIDYYSVTFETAAAAPVPVPAAVWLFGSALVGFGAFARRKTACSS